MCCMCAASDKTLALWELACSSARNRKAVVAAGGVQAVVAAMCAHESDARVQEIACAALQELILAVGGVQALVDSMNEHVTVAKVQENACAALLLKLACSSDDKQEAIGAAGDVQEVVAARRAFKSVAKV